MAWYKTGTVSLTNGSTSVVGVGTKFVSNARVGDGFRAPDGQWYEIINFASETNLGIYPSYQGATISGSVNYMIAPLQGYNKDSADRLRAITDSLSGAFVKSVNTRTGDVVLSKTDVGLGNVDNTSDANKPVSTAQLTALNAKQALNTNLTAFAGLTGVADRIPYFTGAGALSLSVLTAKARALNARTDTAGMQAELSLVPVTSFTDMTAGRLVTPGWLGLGDALPITPGQNYNTLTQPGEYFYGSGTAPTNAPIVPAHLISVKGRGIYPYQEVRPIYGNDVYQRSAKVANPTSAAADWNTWNISHTTSNSQLDPALGSGGIMSTSVISGFRVDKYLNGTMVLTGKVSLASQPANSNAYQTLTLPVTFLNTANMIPLLTCNANATSDVYGVTFQRAATQSSILYAVRNGATAQTFEVNVLVWGTWK